MSNRLDRDFEKLINEYDKEQENLNSYNPEQWEIDLDKYIDERYFKFTVPSILDSEHQKE